MLPLGGDMEAPQDHIMVSVVPGVPGRYITEHMEVYPDNLIHLGPHLPTLLEHAPSPAVPCPWDAAWEEVTGHVP